MLSLYCYSRATPRHDYADFLPLGKNRIDQDNATVDFDKPRIREIFGKGSSIRYSSSRLLKKRADMAPLAQR